MPCPHCENTVPHTSSQDSPCPHCASGHTRSEHTRSGHSRSEHNTGAESSAETSHDGFVREATDVEVLSPEQAQQQYGEGRTHYSENTTRGERVSFWHFTQGGGFQGNVFQGNMFQGVGGFGQNNTVSCLPALLLIATAVGLAIQFGFFAGLGFLFFYAIGSVVSMALFVRSALQGRVTSLTLWTRRALVWGASFLLTVLLAS